MEDKIKKYFDQRQIEPSAQAWDRLDGMLEMADKKPKNKVIAPYMIAASLVVILSFVLFWNTESKPKLDATIAQIEKNVEINTPLEVSNNLHTSPAADGVRSIVSASPSEKVKIKASKLTSVENESHEVVRKQGVNDVNVKYEPRQNETSEMNLNTIAKVEEISRQTVRGLQVDVEKNLSKPTLEVVNRNKTKVHIDAKALLASIESQGMKDSKSHVAEAQKKRLSIDPNSLLKDAEEVSSRSFLSKVFKQAKENSETLISAVNSRNIQD